MLGRKYQSGFPTYFMIVGEPGKEIPTQIVVGGVINHDLKRYKWISLSLYKRKREKKRFFKNFVVLTLHRRPKWPFLAKNKG